jgi:hypothetical protein
MPKAPRILLGDDHWHSQELRAAHQKGARANDPIPAFEHATVTFLKIDHDERCALAVEEGLVPHCILLATAVHAGNGRHQEISAGSAEAVGSQIIGPSMPEHLAPVRGPYGPFFVFALAAGEPTAPARQ